MKMRATVIVFVVCIISAVLAYPQQHQPAEIVVYESDANDNSYNFQFETSDGVARTEEGNLKDSGDPEDPTLLQVKGGYSYTDNEGHEHKVSYTADENGFRILPGST